MLEAVLGKLSRFHHDEEDIFEFLILIIWFQPDNFVHHFHPGHIYLCPFLQVLCLDASCSEQICQLCQLFVYFFVNLGELFQRIYSCEVFQSLIVLFLNFGLETRGNRYKCRKISPELIFHFLVSHQNIVFIELATVVNAFKGCFDVPDQP